MASWADWANLWCRLFGYYSCYGLSALEAFIVGGTACLVAVFIIMKAFNLLIRLLD